MKLTRNAYIIVGIVTCLAVVITLFILFSGDRSKNVDSSIPDSTASSMATPSSPKPEPTDAKGTITTSSEKDNKTNYEINRKKLTDNTNIREFVSFKNRNTIFYTSLSDNKLSLYGADINKEGNIGGTLLFDEEFLGQDNKGMWDLAPGSVTDSLLYFTDSQDGASVVTNNPNSLSRTKLYSIKDGQPISRVLFRKADDEVIYAKGNYSNKSIDVLSNSIDFNGENLIYQIKPQPYDSGQKVSWIDISNDEQKILYCLEDKKAEKSSLWILDLKDKKCSKLVDNLYVLTARWSGDGNKIVFSAKESNESTNIFVYDFKLNSSIRITTGENKSFSPDWSYYGDNILYISEEKGLASLYVIGYQ